MGRRLLILLSVGVVAALLAGVLAFFVQVHQATADWWPSAVPTRVQYDGRDFSCGNRHTEARPSELSGMTARGRTIGGGTIYAPPGFELPDGIAVRAGTTFFYCPLSGGT